MDYALLIIGAVLTLGFVATIVAPHAVAEWFPRALFLPILLGGWVILAGEIAAWSHRWKTFQGTGQGPAGNPDGGNQIAQLSYPHLHASVIFDKVEEFYKRFYFRPRKIGAIVGEMVRDFDMMKRRLREGVEFFDFLRRRKEAA